jgi:hypothetical protein
VVAEELVLNDTPHLTSGAATLADGCLEVDRERAKEPREDDVIHLQPAGGGGRSSVDGDVVVEGEALEGQHDEVMPTGVMRIST